MTTIQQIGPFKHFTVPNSRAVGTTPPAIPARAVLRVHAERALLPAQIQQ